MSVGKKTVVALVGPLPPPYGGMANQTSQLGRLLEKEGLQVRLVQTNRPYRPAWAGGIKGVRALFRLFPYLRALWVDAGRSNVMHLMANSGWSWHLFAAPAIWVARLRGVPVIVNYRGGEAAVFLERSERLVKVSMNRVAALVVPSGYLQKIFRDHGIEARVIPNIVDLERFKPSGPREAPSKAPHLIVCRNLEKIYDNATALRAFARVLEACPRARLTIAGEGNERAELERLARELGVADRVEFSGRLDVDAMQRLYASADLMLNASRVDNMPNALLESMSMGVPIVTTEAGGIPYIVEHERTALLVAVGDWRSMADAAIRLLQDETLHANLARAGKEEVKRYQWSVIKQQWLSIYEEVTAQQGAQARRSPGKPV